MDKTELLQRLRHTFGLELEEHLASLGAGLLALETGASGSARAAAVTQLFRAAHSLKGAARAVEYPAIADLCHRMEALIGGFERDDVHREPESVQLLFDCVDALEAASRPNAPGGLLAPSFGSLTEALRAAAHNQAFDVAPAPEDTEAPSPSPAGRAHVNLDRLDELFAQAGELSIARAGFVLDQEAVADLADNARRFGSAWRAGAHRLRSAFAGTSKQPRHLEALAFVEKTRRRLQRLEQDIDGLAAQLSDHCRQLDRVAVPLEYQVRGLRMLPVSELSGLLQRTVRDSAKELEKQAELRLSGVEIEVDRAVLDGLKHALVHLVRNAVAHGIEAPRQRLDAAKDPVGVVRVQAELKGPHVELRVADDGGGIDEDALAARAAQRGLAVGAGREDRLRLVFLPGMSTSPGVTQLAGRGIGLDVALSAVEGLLGTIEVRSEPGRGTEFSLLLPLTLTSLRAVEVRVGRASLCFAGTNVIRLLRVSWDETTTVQGRPLLPFEGTLLPLANLGVILGSDSAPARLTNGKLPVVVLAGGDRRAAVVVDELVREREVVVKDLGPRLADVPLVAGATLLETGAVGLILNAAEVVRAAFGAAAERPVGLESADEPGPRPVVLVADDSSITRSLVKSVLTAAGYEVVSAEDGDQAWAVLERGAVDVVVADVQMPHLDGLALTARIRASPRHRDVPVVLLSSLGSERDRRRGLLAGASAYLPKRSFDQSELLATLAQWYGPRGASS